MNNNMGALGFDDQGDGQLPLLNGISRKGRDAKGEFMGFEPGPRRAEMIIKEPGCNGRQARRDAQGEEKRMPQSSSAAGAIT